MSHICKYCGKEFKTGQSLGAHIIGCIKNPNNNRESIKIKQKENFEKRNPLEEHILKCQVCGKEYKLQIRHKQFEEGKYKKTCCSECAHKLTTLNTNLEEKNNKISKALEQPKETKTCPICQKEFVATSKSKYCSTKCKEIGIHINISNAIKGKAGGLRPNAYKKYKSGLYHGIHCDSSWELAFVIYCEEHNIQIKRNSKPLFYIFEDKEYKYYPDFIINNQLYEIKGYENNKAIEKHKQHPEVIYLDKEKMKKYIDYVIEKYGKDFINLYDRLDKIPD